MQRSDETIGWRRTHVVAACVLVVLAALCALLLRDRPDSGASAQRIPTSESTSDDGFIPTAPPEASPDSHPAQRGPLHLQRRGRGSRPGPYSATCSSWADKLPCRCDAGARGAPGCPLTLALLYASMCSACAIGGGIDLFTASIAREGGADVDVALLVFVPMGLVGSLASIGAGVLLDRGTPPHRLVSSGCAVMGAAALLGILLGTARGAIAYALLRGVGNGCVFPAITFAIPHYFGVRHVGLLLGGNQAVAVLGTCIGAWLVGASPVAFGSFAPALVALAIPAVALASLNLLLLRAPPTELAALDAAAATADDVELAAPGPRTANISR